MGLTPALSKALYTHFNIKSPTKTQTALLPAIFSKRPILLKNLTGSGKTLGIILALLNKQKKPKVSDNKKKEGVSCMFLLPNRYIAQQVYDWSKNILLAMNHTAEYVDSQVQIVVNDAKTVASQNCKLSRIQPRILIGTPNRILELYDAKAVMLDDLDSIVLDEVDKLVSDVHKRYTTVTVKFNAIRHPLYGEQLVDKILEKRDKKIQREKELELENLRNSGELDDSYLVPPTKEVKPYKAPSDKPNLKHAKSKHDKNRHEQEEKEVVEENEEEYDVEPYTPTANGIQFIACSATLNSSLRNFLIHRGWFSKAETLVLDLNGTAQTPSSLDHYCIVMCDDGTLRDVDTTVKVFGKDWDREKHIEMVRNKEKHGPALPDDHADVLSVVSGVVKKMTDMEKTENKKKRKTDKSIARAAKNNIGILFANSALSIESITQRLRDHHRVQAKRIWLDFDKNEVHDQDVTTDKQIIENHPGPMIITKTSPTPPSSSILSSQLSTTLKSTLLCLEEHSGRGLDIPNAKYVIILGKPSSISSYLHMSGRTARNGASGKVITIIPGERYEAKMVSIFKLLGVTPKSMHEIYKEKAYR